MQWSHHIHRFLQDILNQIQCDKSFFCFKLLKFEISGIMFFMMFLSIARFQLQNVDLIVWNGHFHSPRVSSIVPYLCVTGTLVISHVRKPGKTLIVTDAPPTCIELFAVDYE